MQDARGNRGDAVCRAAAARRPAPFDDAQNLSPQQVTPCYDIAGNLLFQHSMDAGERWLLNDAAGEPIVSWNSRGFRSHATYDELHRPLETLVIGADPADRRARADG